MFFDSCQMGRSFKTGTREKGECHVLLQVFARKDVGIRYSRIFIFLWSASK